MSQLRELIPTVRDSRLKMDFQCCNQLGGKMAYVSSSYFREREYIRQPTLRRSVTRYLTLIENEES